MSGTGPALPRRFPTVVHALVHAAQARPEARALVCGEESLTYRQYAACVAGLAAELRAHGAAGGRVALMMANSLDIAIATLAAQAAGAQVVPLNPQYTVPELEPILANAEPRVLIHDADCAAAREARCDGALRIAVGPAQRLVRWADRPALADTLGGPGLPLPSGHDASTLQYTGGTTGRSKGVDLTHGAVSINVSQREAMLPTVLDDERVLAITPLFHVYAVAMGLYLALWARGELVILPRYRPEAVLEAIARHRITLLSGSPTIFVGLMGYEGFARADLSSLRWCSSGSAALSVETLRRWEAATGCPICEGYGQSEAGPVLTYNPLHGTRKVGSVGIALPATEVQVVDTETGTRVLGPGEIGEIRARGPQIMRGYRGLPAETATALREGWLHTGDVGEFDADGYLTIRDRLKDMAIVGGYNVYPREVEEALVAHPAVAEAAVVGVPDAYRGEALVAYVVPRAGEPVPGAEALLAHLAARLVKYKHPSRIEVLEALPKTTVGKTDKTRLRAMARAGGVATPSRA